MKKVLAILSIGCLATVSYAAEQQLVDYTSKDTNTSDVLDSVNSLNDLNTQKFKSLDNKEQSKIAKDYNLTPTEYQSYLTIRSSTAIGQYYDGKNLNPNFILADYNIEQGNTKEADKYIANYAKAEHDEVARDIEIQQKFQRFVLEQNPKETPIMLKGPIPKDYTTFGYPRNNGLTENVLDQLNSDKLTSNAEYVLIEAPNYVDKNTSGLFKKISTLKHVKLDIYFIGDDVTDATIVEWAKNHAIGSLIAEKKVTINHSGQFVKDLNLQLKQTLQAGTLIKANSGNYRVIPWKNINETN